MAIKFNFDGKQVIEPGSYARIINGTTQTPSIASFGKVMIIDTGSGAFWGGGGSINGELTSAKNAVYEFDDISDYKNFVRGGVLWDIADYLFNPSNSGAGIPAIQIVKAATTTAASLTYTFAGSGNVTKTGTITVLGSDSSSSAAGTVVVGTGTKFTTELHVGDTVKTSGNVTIGVVDTIINDTMFTLVVETSISYHNIIFKAQLSQPQGGTLTIKARHEGKGGDGYLVNGVLVKGFGAKLSSGILDTTKFIMKFYTGTYRGINNVEPTFVTPVWDSAVTYAANTKVQYDGLMFQALLGTNLNRNPLTQPTYWQLFSYQDNFGDALPGTTTELTLMQSPEFASILDLINWMNTDFTFMTNFKLSSSNVVGGGMIDAVDLAANVNYNLFTGGTESYSSSDLDATLFDIADEDNTFFLCDNYFTAAQSTNNTKILSHILNEAEFNKFMVIGAGYDVNSFNTPSGSIGTAAYYNSAKAIVVHSGIKVPKVGGGLKNLPSLYTAAEYLGRTAGLEPQVPSTWKDLRMSSPVQELNKRDRERCLLAGVVHVKLVDGKGWVINQSINSLQKNDVLVNASGDSYEVSIERIKAQLNKELILNSRLLFVGGNYNTASAMDVKLFTEGYLTFRTARPNLDNLILSFQDVTVKLVGDSWQIQYAFVPNGPINKLFFTGVILDANLSV